MSGSRRFSRWMKPRGPASLGVGGISCLAVIAAVVIALVWAQPIVVPLAVPIVLWATVMGKRQNARLRRMAQARAGESICTFARAFPRRAVDPWVVRAVYEEVGWWFSFPGGRLPLRPTDRFKEDLSEDGDSLDEFAVDIAQRCRRSMEDTEKNPFYGKVKTVGDLVYFLSHQPRLRTA